MAPPWDFLVVETQRWDGVTKGEFSVMDTSVRVSDELEGAGGTR
jgi:hypothetical protein